MCVKTNSLKKDCVLLYLRALIFFNIKVISRLLKFLDGVFDITWFLVSCGMVISLTQRF